VASFLVLWDVDFTLVNASGIGRHLYRLAFAELYSRELPEQADAANMAGRTDRAIALDVLALAGVPDPRGEVSFFEAALASLAPGLGDLVRTTAKALPGAAAALAALAALGSTDGGTWPDDHRPDHHTHDDHGPDHHTHDDHRPDHHTHDRHRPDGVARQSLLTGNVRPLAEVKLAPLGLTKYLDLNVGAYGNESEVRAELVHLARKRAALAYRQEFDGQATIVIGDTPLDIGAALTTGARAVAVATGHFTTNELAGSGAHAVLPDLTDTEAVLDAVLTR